MEPAVLNLCPTGMVPTREMTPHAPLQPDEIVADVLACAEIGITSVHIHARDADGVPTHRKDVYARIVEGIRSARPDLVIGVSCSGRTNPDLEPRSEVLELSDDLKPDCASLTLASLNFPGQASVNSPDVVRGLAERMMERGIKAELEIFDIGMANYARYLTSKGLLRPPHYANLFFGNVATAQPRFADMAAMVAALPEETTWAFAGIGRSQKPAVTAGLTFGGGGRIGLEDNIWHDEARTRLTTNRELVSWAHEMLQLQGRELMSSAAFRERFLTT